MARTGTRPQRATIEARNAQAISMALAGASYDDIAQALGPIRIAHAQVLDANFRLHVTDSRLDGKHPTHQTRCWR